MAKPNQRTKLDQPIGLGGNDRIGADPQLVSRATQQVPITDGLRRHDEQQVLCLGRKRGNPLGEALFDTTRERRSIGEPESTRKLTGGKPARQLEQRQRGSARLRDDRIPHLLVYATRKSDSCFESDSASGEPSAAQPCGTTPSLRDFARRGGPAFVYRAALC